MGEKGKSGYVEDLLMEEMPPSAPAVCILKGGKISDADKLILDRLTVPPTSSNRYSYFIVAYGENGEKLVLEKSYFIASSDFQNRDYLTATSGLDAVNQMKKNSSQQFSRAVRIKVSIVEVGY